MRQPYKRIAVKVGSNVLTRADGTLDITRMSALADQIAALHKSGIEVILVSSGAVASGKSEICPTGTLDEVDQRQLFSAVGQAKLINRYFELFREHGIPVGQVLTVKENFASHSHYVTQQNCMKVMLENGVIPIVNENDTISLSELMFTDNDELSGQIATMMDVQALIILSNIDGLYNGAPTDPTAHILREIRPDDRLDDYIQSGKSSLGRGGMHTKTRIARQIAAQGIDVYIANGKRNDILTDLMERPEETPCTHFLPSTKPTGGNAPSPSSPSLEETFVAARAASLHLLALSDEEINRALLAVADAVEEDTPWLLEENHKDLARMSPSDPKYDRLKLTEGRLKDIADGIRHVATLPSPLGRILKESTLPNGLRLQKKSFPFGVIGIIYEARPNVTLDVFALCLKSGNACLLKGGSDADQSNRALVRTIHRVLSRLGIDTRCVELLPATHEAATELMHAEKYVDLIIPRGGSRLIDFVRREATVPVIETGAGICHTYFDRNGDLSKGMAIVLNAKTRRVSVCNALDCLLVDRRRLSDLPQLCAPLAEKEVNLYADAPAYAALQGHYPNEWLRPATEEDFGREFLDYKMAVKTVEGLDEALAHIRRYSSRHSECIVTEDTATAARFCRDVDAACVYVNAPTSFTDGGQFGMGAEIGISTQKLHARGPMALEEITTYKWIVEGNGQVRKP